MRPLLKYWLPVLLWMILIFLGSTDLMSSQHTSRFLGPFLRWLVPNISDVVLEIIQLSIRKCAHVAQYAVLAVLLFRAFRRSGIYLLSPTTSAFIVAAIYAVLDEFHQSFVLSRTASPYDVALDLAGTVTGLMIYRFLIRRVKPEPAIKQI